MATSVLQTRVDTETKLEAESLFDSLGLDITTAIRLFLRQSINQQRIPFDDCPKEGKDQRQYKSLHHEDERE